MNIFWQFAIDAFDHCGFFVRQLSERVYQRAQQETYTINQARNCGEEIILPFARINGMGPDQKWDAGISYIWTIKGRRYLAIAIATTARMDQPIQIKSYPCNISLIQYSYRY